MTVHASCLIVISQILDYVPFLMQQLSWVLHTYVQYNNIMQHHVGRLSLVLHTTFQRNKIMPHHVRRLNCVLHTKVQCNEIMPHHVTRLSWELHTTVQCNEIMVFGIPKKPRKSKFRVWPFEFGSVQVTKNWNRTDFRVTTHSYLIASLSYLPPTRLKDHNGMQNHALSFTSTNRASHFLYDILCYK